MNFVQYLFDWENSTEILPRSVKEEFYQKFQHVVDLISKRNSCFRFLESCYKNLSNKRDEIENLKNEIKKLEQAKEEKEHELMALSLNRDALIHDLDDAKHALAVAMNPMDDQFKKLLEDLKVY